jgi:hypothetical protein
VAEINIERKERNAWPWILAGLALLALLVWFVARRDDGVTRGTAGGTVADSVVGTDTLTTPRPPQ